MPYEERECPCGTVFVPKHPRQSYHAKTCRRDWRTETRTRNHVRDQHWLVFTAVDGEGVTDPETGEHDYVMLSVGTETFVRPDRERMTYIDVFEALWSQFLINPENTYVGFYLGYDFSQWFRTLPESIVRSLLTDEGIRKRRRKTQDGTNLPPIPVRLGPWEFDVLGSKRFKLRKRPDERWMYINDAGPFFQSSFLTAIDPKSWPKPIVTAKEYDVIREGKQQRSTAVLDANMARYNRTENIALERLMGTLNTGFVQASIRLDRDAWYGPGQAAQQWLNNINAPTRREVEDATPTHVLEAAQATYYGGWFEIFSHGIVPGVSYEYDINSAYPYAISQLPDFRSGRWVRELCELADQSRIGAPSLVRCTVRGPSLACGALPYRDHNGKIFRPREVSGWYWAHEILAAIEAGLIKDVQVHERHDFHPSTDNRPFADIAAMYQRRLAVGKNSPEGKAFKLVYNSAYGKMAQSIGSPKYASALHASLITSETRRMILDAIATHPRKSDALLMVATDGVYFDSRHPTLDCSADRLGAWDETDRTNLTLFMPGVYWDDDARERLRCNAGIKIKSRGISASALADQLEACDAAWTRIRDRLGAGFDGDWPAIAVPLRFEMVTAKQALNRGRWDLAGTVRTPEHPGETPLVKELSSDPSAKRSWPYVVVDGPGGPRLTSTSYGRGETLETTPYSERFGRELALERDGRGLDADGMVIEDTIRELMRGH
jgi:hypothetical protein